MESVKLQWRNNGQQMQLWVYEIRGEEGKFSWVHYSASRHYQIDSLMGSKSGFNTAQRYLKLGAKYLDADYREPTEWQKEDEVEAA